METRVLIQSCPKPNAVNDALDERGMCIMGLIWPPLELKTENCFSQNYFDWFTRRMTEV